MNLRKLSIPGLLVCLLAVGQAQETKPSPGVLLLAHGGRNNWNEKVSELAAEVNKSLPVEVAFGMATKRNIQDAVDRLVQRGVREIVAVPLFVSSHSSVITSTEYLLSLRAEAPPELALYAKMSHDHGGGHAGHHPAGAGFDPASPIQSPVPVRMASALNRNPLVADILLSRAKSMSRDPEHEVVVVVAHGPVSDDENSKWLADMGALVERMRIESKFRRIEYLTVRDDAPAPIRAQAAAELRSVVERATGEGQKVLLVPLLISYGGIETGIEERLKGLSYTMSRQGLLPDERLAQWVIQAAKSARVAAPSATNALLVVAHGSSTGAWNDQVVRVVNQVDWSGPKAVAFLTPRSPAESLANAAARLDQTGVDRIVIVPLMVSSFSEHHEELRYYAKQRNTAPGHVHGEALNTRAGLTLTRAMDDAPLLARILADQAKSVSTDPGAESVVLVAHGPNGDADNAQWLGCLKSQAERLQQSLGFRRVEFITLRDDAPNAIRDAATAELREKVRLASMDTKVLVVPVLISVGHAQAGIGKRLEGLSFTMCAGGVSSHPLAAEWIRQQANGALPQAASLTR